MPFLFTLAMQTAVTGVVCDNHSPYSILVQFRRRHYLWVDTIETTCYLGGFIFFPLDTVHGNDTVPTVEKNFPFLQVNAAL